MSKSRSHRKLSAGALLTLLATAASGQQNLPQAVVLDAEEEEEIRRYSVELIVFEYVDSASAGSEIFLPDAPQSPLVEDDFLASERFVSPAGTYRPGAEEPPLLQRPAGEDTESPLAPAPVENLEEIPTYERAGLVILRPEEYVLDDIYASLERLDAYRPLLHAAWSQPTLGKEETVPVKLRRLGNPPLRLDGTVTLYLSRFLHLVLDLSLEEKAPQRPGRGEDRIRDFGDNRSSARFGFDSRYIEPSTFYRIREDRIVRNGELRYYDHPKFGVIAKITRIEEDTADEMDTTDDLLPGGINR